MRETLERRLTAERPHGTYDDTRAGHDAFSRGVVEDYDHGNHHLARATLCPADPGLVTCAGLSALDAPGTDAPIIDELARASDPNTIASVLADAALLDLDRYATGRGLRYSRVGTALMLAAKRPALGRRHRCRRRVQQDTTGHRARTGDPLYPGPQSFARLAPQAHPTPKGTPP